MKIHYITLSLLVLTLSLISCSNYQIKGGVTVKEGTTSNSFYKIWDPGNTNKVVIGFHGYSSGIGSWTSSYYPDRVEIRQKFLENGYVFAVCETKYDLCTWGNKQSTEAYQELYALLCEKYHMNSISIYCNSMGGIESLNFIKYTNVFVDSYIATSMTYNLTQIYQDGKYTDSIENAYSLNDINELKEYDPSKYVFKDNILNARIMVIYSSKDESINQTFNSKAFYERVKNDINLSIEDDNYGHYIDIHKYIDDIMNFCNGYNNNICH